MSGFCKLHSSILDSSIWLETAATRIVWITLLAMADARGVVHASPRGLARRANVTEAECAEAIARFLAPDLDSRDGTDGRRIEKTAGGWQLLNYLRFRGGRDPEERREYQAQWWRDKNSAQTRPNSTELDQPRPDSTDLDQTRPDSTTTRPSSTQAEAEAEADKKQKQNSARKRATRPQDVSAELWNDWIAHRRAKRATATQTALDQLRNEADKAGQSLSDVMRQCIAQGWTGFRASWAAAPVAGKPQFRPAKRTEFAGADYGAGGDL